MKVVYTNKTLDKDLGTYPFKNATGSNSNKLWCEFLPTLDPDFINSPGYQEMKGASAFDKRS